MNREIFPPLKAIRAKCLDCSCYSEPEVKLCVIKDCSLYPYRLGKHPNIKKKELTEGQKEDLRERLKKANEIKFAKNMQKLSIKNNLPL